jgi:PPM family protein phosphatase
MGFDSEWITHKGTLTDDNRDYCGIALRGGEALYVVCDGSTNGVQSGDLSDVFIRKIADWFITEPSGHSADEVIPYLNELSLNLKTSYPAGRLSFFALIYSGDSSITALHSGDCRLGRISEDDTITWLTRAHTLANATEDICNEDLAQHKDRHVLTRNFRPGRPCNADKRQLSLMAGERLIIATDGYWADLDNRQQSEFINKSFVPSSPRHDDVSCLVLERLTDSDGTQSQGGVRNFYLVRE